MENKEGFIDPSSKEELETEKIYKHIEKYIGKPVYTSFDLIPGTSDISLYTCLADSKRNYHTIITSGMSKQPANAPEDQSVWKYTELVIYLPKSWHISKETIMDYEQYWPLGWLKKLGSFPHENNTWFCWGDTIPNGEQAMPFASDTAFCCMLLLPPIREDECFFELKIDKEKTIRFLVVVPIYKEEMEFILNNGFKKLLAKFDEFNINDIIKIDRLNTCK